MRSSVISWRSWSPCNAISSDNPSMHANGSFIQVVFTIYLFWADLMSIWRAGWLHRTTSTSDRLLAQADCKSRLRELASLFSSWYLISGEVFQGTWNKTTIALKVLKADGVAASSEVRLILWRIHAWRLTFFPMQAIRREIDVRCTKLCYLVRIADHFFADLVKDSTSPCSS